ncbi:MAG: taxon MazF [Desulfuromonas sp. SDB]|nr:MAG: taxon MazF [Desulfuromonas sp. SDB]
MKIKKFHIYYADLNPRFGTEPGKIRPVVVIQTNLLNNIHPGTIICPVTTKTIKGIEYLRVSLNEKMNKLKQKSHILVDQIRTIDNRRLIGEIGKLSYKQKEKLLSNLKILIFE